MPDSIEKLREMIKDIDFAMLSTVGPDGTIHSRPMATQQAEFDGELWFFTALHSLKVHEIQDDQHVNVSYADSDANRYVSVSGRASIVRDRNKAKELWSPIHKAWFPMGVDDPNLGLIKVTVEQAEYWDAPSSKMVQLYGFVKSTLTGSPPDAG